MQDWDEAEEVESRRKLTFPKLGRLLKVQPSTHPSFNNWYPIGVLQRYKSRAGELNGTSEKQGSSLTFPR
jgi:hypothetical protein